MPFRSCFDVFVPATSPFPQSKKYWKAQNTSNFAGIIAVSTWDLMQNQILRRIPYTNCHSSYHSAHFCICWSGALAQIIPSSGMILAEVGWSSHLWGTVCNVSFQEGIDWITGLLAHLWLVFLFLIFCGRAHHEAFLPSFLRLWILNSMMIYTK